MTVFVRAQKLVPSGQTLARVGLAWSASRALFERGRTKPSAFAIATVPRELAASTNAALRSNVQFLTRSGWK